MSRPSVNVEPSESTQEEREEGRTNSPRRVLLAWVDNEGSEGPSQPQPPPQPTAPPVGRRRSSAAQSACLLWPYLRPQCTHPRVSEWVGATNALLRGGAVSTVFTQEQFTEVLSAFTALQDGPDGETRLARVKLGGDAPWESIMVIGDLHGQRADLLGAVLGPFLGGKKAAHLLFLGDFVDRGPDGADVVALIMLLKLLYPSWITLLRGNHEEPSVTQVYGYARELDAKYPRDDAGGTPGMGGFGMAPHPLWTASHDAFAYVPVAAVVESHTGKRVFFCHGGLAPPLLQGTVEELVPNIPPLVDACPLMREGTGDEEGTGASERDQQLLDGLLWSDPTDELDPAECDHGMEPNQRGCGWIWAPEATHRFLSLNRFEWICRAHQCVMGGYQWAHDNRVLTVFSAANYCGTSHNLGAILNLTTDQEGAFVTELVTHTSDSVSTSVPQSSLVPCYFQSPNKSKIGSEFLPIQLPLESGGSAEEHAATLRKMKAEGKTPEGGVSVELLEAALELCGVGGKRARWRYTDDAGTDEEADFSFDFRVEGRQVVGGSCEGGTPIEGSRLVVCIAREGSEVQREGSGPDLPDLVIVEGQNTYRGHVEGKVMKGRWHSGDDGSCGDFMISRLD
eukprot:Hpha_TRINITY_DN14722_c0_g1::TRINITY_DN14722_c0_g1_i1::g.103047::m.103047